MKIRPSYHITAPRNWLNDPNGPIHHNGRYHVFYQYNPDAPSWGSPHWGHVSSVDLVHWDRHPVALSPDGTGPDADGIWSGCARHIDGQVALFYTGVTGLTDADRVESVCRANGSDDLGTWTRSPDNPLITGPPPELATLGHRDPYLVREADGWGLLLGAGLGAGTPEAAGAVLRYHSADLREWDYVGPLFQRPANATGLATFSMWECPQLVRIDGRDVLIWSVQDPLSERSLRYAVYAVGQVVDGQFTMTSMGRVDHGETFYAPAVTTDATGRHLMWGWLQEDAKEPDDDTTHAGALSLPRQFRLDGDRMVVEPVPELGRFGTSVVGGSAVQLAAGEPLALPEAGHHFRVVATLPDTDAVVGLALGWDPDGDEATIVRVDRGHGRFGIVDRVHGVDHRRDDYVGPLEPDAATLTVTLYVDGNILEVFTDCGTALTCRLPAHSQAPALLLCADTDVTLVDVAVDTFPAHGIVGE